MEAVPAVASEPLPAVLTPLVEAPVAPPAPAVDGADEPADGADEPAVFGPAFACEPAEEPAGADVPALEGALISPTLAVPASPPAQLEASTKISPADKTQFCLVTVALYSINLRGALCVTLRTARPDGDAPSRNAQTYRENAYTWLAAAK